MFQTTLLKAASDSEAGFRYFAIATGVFPAVCIFAYSGALIARHKGMRWLTQPGDTSAVPPHWVFSVVWPVLVVLWLLVVVNAAMELTLDALIALVVYHLGAMVFAVLWLWTSERYPKKGAGSWVMAALVLFALLVLSVLLSGAWQGGDANSAWLTASLWVPVVAWAAFASILSVVDAEKKKK